MNGLAKIIGITPKAMVELNRGFFIRPSSTSALMQGKLD